MNNLEDMISSVLSNPDEMKKVMDMAGTLFGGANSDAAPEQPNLENIGAALGSMPPLGGILSGLSNLPGGLASAAGKLIGGGLDTSNDKTQLLEAMKPWLSEKRRNKLDSAMKVAKVMKVAGAAFFKKGG